MSNTLHDVVEALTERMAKLESVVFPQPAPAPAPTPAPTPAPAAYGANGGSSSPGCVGRPDYQGKTLVCTDDPHVASLMSVEHCPQQRDRTQQPDARRKDATS